MHSCAQKENAQTSEVCSPLALFIFLKFQIEPVQIQPTNLAVGYNCFTKRNNYSIWAQRSSYYFMSYKRMFNIFNNFKLLCLKHGSYKCCVNSILFLYQWSALGMQLSPPVCSVSQLKLLWHWPRLLLL